MVYHCKIQASISALGELYLTPIDRIRYRYLMARMFSSENQIRITADNTFAIPLSSIWPGYHKTLGQFGYGIVVDIIQNTVNYAPLTENIKTIITNIQWYDNAGVSWTGDKHIDDVANLWSQ